MSLHDKIRTVIPYRSSEQLGALLGMSGYDVEQTARSRIVGGSIPPAEQYRIANARLMNSPDAVERLTGGQFSVSYDGETLIPAHVRGTLDAVIAQMRTVAVSRANKPHPAEYYINHKIIPEVIKHPADNGDYGPTLIAYGKELRAGVAHATREAYPRDYMVVRDELTKLLTAFRAGYKDGSLLKRLLVMHGAEEQKKQKSLF